MDLRTLFLTGDKEGARGNRNGDRKEVRKEERNDEREEEREHGEAFYEIPPVAAISSRNASLTEWRAAQFQDRAHVLKRSPYGMVQTMAFEFLTSHIFKIFVCYILLSILCLSLPIFIALTNNTSTAWSASSWSLLHPWNHSHLVVLSPALDSMARIVIPPNLGYIISPSKPVLVYIVWMALLVLLPKMLFDYIFRPLLFLSTYSPAMYWFVSYGLALGVRTVLLAVIVSVRWVFSSVWGLLRVILRATVWCQFIRRKVRGAVKAIKKMLIARLGLPPAMFRGDVLIGTISVCAVCVGLAMGTGRAYSRAVGVEAIYSVGTLFVSISTLALTAVAVILLLLTIGLKTPDSKPVSEEGVGPGSPLNSGKYDHSIQLCLLLAPLPFLSFPTAYFSYTLLFLPTKTFSAALPLFELFGPERLTFSICLLAIISHIIISRQTGYVRAYVRYTTQFLLIIDFLSCLSCKCQHHHL